MDIEDENILKTIFKDSFPDSWRENHEVSQYLRELGSYNLERINKEPDVIQEEKDVLLEQTQDLVFRNYKTFIQTAECSKEIFRDFSTIENNLDELTNELPNFIDKCQTFCKKSQEINAKRRLSTLTLAKHPQLLEILEMSQLMDTCVRNRYYDEALELSAYVFRLEKKYPNIPIIQTIAKEIQDSMKLLLSQLVRQLRTNILLPECLKVIGYLRRMNVFTEEELRIKFLHARDSWYQNIINVIPYTDAYQHITKVIEASRVHLFDIITQYKAIFADDEPFTIVSKDTQYSYAAILHGWVAIKISQFLSVLETDLQKDIGSRIDSVLGQCMYFGLSFSRVGADFRGLLVPLFEDNVIKTFKAKMVDTSNRFHITMQSYVLISPPTMLVSSVLASTAAAQDKLHPPLSILEFQPLVELCNNVLTAFNDLRILAPVSIAGDIANILQQCLMSTINVLVDYHKAEESSMSTRENEIFVKFCSQHANVLLPYLDECLQAIYPQQQLAQVIGVSASELVKLGKVGRLKCSLLVEPIAFLLPPSDNELDQREDFLNTVEELQQVGDSQRVETASVPVETTVGNDEDKLETSASVPVETSVANDEDKSETSASANEEAEQPNLNDATSEDTVDLEIKETPSLVVTPEVAITDEINSSNHNNEITPVQ
ncbi:conserved oligomeric Golgi complex component [Chamberlinius hualienensis]